MSRRFLEKIQELTAMATPRSEVFRWLEQLGYHRGRARLSFEAHLYAQARQTIVATARSGGVEHFMCYPTGCEFSFSGLFVTLQSFSSDGLLARYAWTIKTHTEWVRTFEALNARRKKKVPFPGLGLRFNSNELYWPIPESILEDAQQVSDIRRAEMQSSNTPPPWLQEAT